MAASPDDVLGLQYRWRADSIAQSNGSKISTWPPLAGGETFMQFASTKQPTYRTSGFGGRPTVRTNGTSQSMMATVSPRSQPTTLILVMKWNSVAAQSQALDAVGTQVLVLPPQWDTWTGVDLISSSNAPITPVVHSSVLNGASSRMLVNGTQVAAGNVGGGSLGPNLELGARSNTRFASADFAEVLIYSGALTPTQLATVHTYVQDWYGIAVADYASAPPAPTGRLVDSWDGTKLVRRREDRWNGTALIPVIVD